MNGNASTERGAGPGPVTGEGQLWALLQDLVEREGRDAAAERLGLSERTIRRTLTDRHLSRRMTEALLRERDRRHAAGPPRSPPEERREQREQREQPRQPEQSRRAEVGAAGQLMRQLDQRFGRLEQTIGERLDELGGELDTWRQGATEQTERLQAEVEGLRESVAALDRSAASTGGPSAGHARSGYFPPRTFPELVTREPAADDGRVYGAVLALIEEWRGTWKERQRVKYTLDWLRIERRRLELEHRLIGEFELTLPPANRPWSSSERQQELFWCESAYRRVWWQLVWTRLLHGGLRLVTLGAWGWPGPTDPHAERGGGASGTNGDKAP